MKSERCVFDRPDCPSLVTSEQDSERQCKRRKLFNKKQKTPFLPPEIFSIVIPFLHPREMFRLTFTCKAFSKMIRHEDVLRSAMVQGGYSKRNMDKLFPALRDKAIFIPSPLRLLRIANGQRCEKPGCNTGIRQLRPKYGLFVCDRCYSGQCGGTIAVAPQHLSKTDDPQRLIQALDHPRLLKTCFGREYSMWRQPFTDSAGERAGPLVTWVDIEEQVRDKMQSTCDTLSALPLVSDSDYDRLVRAYDISCRNAGIAAEHKGWEWNSKQMNKIRIRIKRAQTIVQKIAAILPERPWKSFALNCTWTDEEDLLVPHEPTVRFHCEFVNEYMEPLMRAPSTVTKKKMMGVALSIQGSFETIYLKGVHDFSFLSIDLSETFEPSLRKYLQKRYSPETFLSGDLVDGEFLSCIEKNNLFRALTHVLGMSCLSAALVPYTEIIQNNTKLIGFAKNIWLRHTLDDDFNSHTEEISSKLYKAMCQSTFCEVKIAHERLHTRAMEYILHPKTSAFIDSSTGYAAGSSEDSLLKSFRMDQVQSVWTDYDCLDFLEASSFDQLYKYHEEKAVTKLLQQL